MLSEKGIIKAFELVVYPVPLIVAIGDVEKEVNKQYELFSPDNGQVIEGNIDRPPEGYGATTYLVRDKETYQYCLLIFVPNLGECKGSNFCHEVGHVALEIFHYIGAHISYDDQEPFCYLLGNLFRLLNGAFYEWKEFCDKKKKKISKKK